ncbi:MAG: sodium:solute symporter family protein, partial [Candidatus Aminicenantales bacterium]
TLTTAYTLITLMTLFWPGVCRRSHAVWTLSTAMLALGLWLVFPELPALFQRWNLPHPIFFCWAVSLVTFFLVALIDRRKILGPQA